MGSKIVKASEVFIYRMWSHLIGRITFTNLSKSKKKNIFAQMTIFFSIANRDNISHDIPVVKNKTRLDTFFYQVGYVSLF